MALLVAVCFMSLLFHTFFGRLCEMLSHCQVLCHSLGIHVL